MSVSWSFPSGLSRPTYRQVEQGMMMATETKERIMAAARLTVQDRGYSGLSFRELAKDVGIKSASIHYYFASKGELGGALAHRYTADFAEYLDGLLAQGLDPETCMARYTDVFGNTLRNDNRMCLAGIMAAEHKELPEEVRSEVVKFGEMNEDWIARVLTKRGSAEPEERRRRARAIFAAIEGAQLVARSRGDVSVYDEIVATYRRTGLIP
jgi:TetR/AcrR family transcriptional regulator, transcriptional repressor for nem operon